MNPLHIFSDLSYIHLWHNHIPFHFYSHSVHMIVICFGSDKRLVEIMSVRSSGYIIPELGVCSLGIILTYMCNASLL